MVYQTINDAPEKEVQDVVVELKIQGESKEIAVKEFNGQRVVTFKDIDNLHQRVEGTAGRNFRENKEQFIEGEDYFYLTGDKLKGFKQATNFVGSNAKELVLITEMGYLMLVKSLQDDLAWQVQRQLVNNYFKVKNLQPKFEQLSPQLQAMINLETRQNELEQKVAATDNKVESIKEVVGVNFTNWRESTIKILKKIGTKLGGYSMYSEVTRESYELLNKRAKADLERRLTNMRRKMADEGMSLSKRNKMNYLDVIGQDPRLIEIYVAVVKEMAIKYGIDLPETA